MQLTGWIGYMAKALFAAAIAFLSGVGAILVGDATFGDITQGQWVAIALATIIALAGVFGINNAPKPGSE